MMYAHRNCRHHRVLLEAAASTTHVQCSVQYAVAAASAPMWASCSCLGFRVGVFTWLLSLPPTSVDTNVLTTNEVHAF